MVRPNITSMICPPTTSTTRWKRPRRTIPSTCRSMRRGSCAGRASSRSRDRGRISAGASVPISATASAMTRSFRRSTRRTGLACSIATFSAPRWRNVVGGCADCRNRCPRPHFIGMSRLLADRPTASASSRMAGRRAGLWRPHVATISKRFPTIRRCRFSYCSKRCSSRGGGPSPWAARLDHRVGSDFRRARR
jgi:hypothetical protein